MSIYFEHARDILEEIIVNKATFSAATRTIIAKKQIEKNSQGLVRSLTSCELHHHYLLDYAVNKFFSDLELTDRLLIQVILANTVFIKRIPFIDSKAYLEQLFDKWQIEEMKRITFYEATEPGTPLIGDEIKPQSSHFLSLKYNAPVWLINMWQKHFGVPNTYKMLKANNKPVLQACRVNTLKTAANHVIETDAQFSLGPINNTVIYQGREPLRFRSMFLENFIFQQRLAVTDLINQVDFESINGDILVVETRPNALYLEIPIASKNRNKIQIITNSVARKLDIQKSISKYNLTNVTVTESEPEQLIAHVSRPQDLIVFVANCSKFDLIRSLPDFFIHFEQDGLDHLIAQQKAHLVECSKFVAEGGLLAYGINTINKKEGQHLIASFVAENKDFILIREKQYFPFDEMNSGLYMAVLRKKLPNS